MMRPRKLLRIARWESTKGVGGFDRGAVAVVLAAAAFIAAVGVVGLVGGVALQDGIYRVGVEESSPFHNPVAEDPAFAVVDPDPSVLEDGDLKAGEGYDVYLKNESNRTRLYLASRGGDPTDKSRAAVASLRESVEAHNERQMRLEENGTAAFPVTVTVQFVEQGGAGSTGGGGSGGAGGGGDGGDGGDGGAGGGLGGDGADDGDGDRFGAPSLGAFDLFGTGGAVGSPSDIAPPFPFQSLVLAFVFVLPLNFVIQAYGSSMLSERLDRRG
ncbi:PrsW family intramembrane metalloprotease, partial [Halobacteriales archaeon QS_1_68_44]